MKRMMLITISVFVFFMSCTTTAGLDKQRASYKGKEPGNEYFVIKTNGERITAAKINRPKVGNHYNDRLIVDGVKIDGWDVFAYQNEEGYFVWYNDPKPTRYWKGTWLKRLRKGKMNLYYEGSEGTTPTSGLPTASSINYYFEKEKGQYIYLTFESFSSALKDNPAALQEFRKLYPKGWLNKDKVQTNIENLPHVVEMYNQ
jgi:hypothetical protein